MDLKNFLKPNKNKIILFIILASPIYLLPLFPFVFVYDIGTGFITRSYFEFIFTSDMLFIIFSTVNILLAYILSSVISIKKDIKTKAVFIILILILIYIIAPKISNHYDEIEGGYTNYKICDCIGYNWQISKPLPLGSTGTVYCIGICPINISVNQGNVFWEMP